MRNVFTSTTEEKHLNKDGPNEYYIGRVDPTGRLVAGILLSRTLCLFT